IAAEDLPNVKSKFFKADKTRPGSGIGLALADEIIRRHGGWIDIDSELGVGTTVTVMLPITFTPPENER
ncbi:MAG: two-component sensor histidine kinase, partial [Clostridia bacterium]|nr:two-component sensor histidine kinase [Clostridia bacterium]